MIQTDATERKLKRRPVMLALPAAFLLLVCGGSAVFAQNMMRGPSVNLSSRGPSLDRGGSVAPITRIDPNIAGRSVNGVMADGPRIRTGCSAAYRDDSGTCTNQPTTYVDRTNRKGKANRTPTETVVNTRTVANEIVAELDGALSEAQADAMARRHGLRRVQSQSFPLIGATIGLFRITGGKTVEAASREFASEAGVRSVQPNFRYLLQDQGMELSEGDPAQYALAKLRLPQAHTLAHGTNVTIAIIDSGIDLKHPEFAGTAITPYDALGSQEGPHPHGTGVAGVIVAHARLMGSAPAAQILAIRAFGASGKGAESTTFVILKGFEFAASHGAQIVNMSFAGPKDALVGRGLTALADKNIVLIAAVGNDGPKSPPLYPAADPHVLAVSATDAKDKLFVASNRGAYIAVAAPGVDIFLPSPDNKYEMRSGTSFSSAFISGLAALMLERNAMLKPDEVRSILMTSARDLGPPGPDDQFGAGEADAFAAVSAVKLPSMPVAAISDRPTEKAVAADVSGAPNAAPAPAENLPAATTVDKPESQPDGNQTKPAGP